MHEQSQQWIQNPFYFENQGKETLTRSKSLPYITIWLIPVVGESNQEFQKATKTFTCLIATSTDASIPRLSYRP